MPKKKPDEDFSPLRDVDNPTAAFPIGTLGGLSARERTPTTPRQPVPRVRDPGEADGGDSELDEEDHSEFEEDDPADDEYFDADDAPTELAEPSIDELLDASRADDEPTDPAWARVGGGVHPAVLVLSLIAGVAMALALVALIGMALLLG